MAKRLEVSVPLRVAQKRYLEDVHNRSLERTGWTIPQGEIGTILIELLIESGVSAVELAACESRDELKNKVKTAIAISSRRRRQKSKGGQQR